MRRGRSYASAYQKHRRSHFLLPCSVYLLASRRYGTLYLGITNDPSRRVHEHRSKFIKGFTAKYDVTRLVWYETYESVVEAIAREKALKKWHGDWKIRLIEEMNPDWADLYEGLNR